MRSFVRALPLCSFAIFFACSSGKSGSDPAPAAKQIVQSSAAEISLDSQLLNAVHNYEKLELDERFSKVVELLDAGANANMKNELGEPLLGDAVHFGDGSFSDYRVVKILVEMGADVNAVGPTGRSPLTKAAEFNRVEVIELLLSRGLEINGENGTRAMVKAAFKGHKQIVELLLAKGLKPTGRYARALMDLHSEETLKASQLFGAYVDIAKEELLPLLKGNTTRVTDSFFISELARIERSCKTINSGEAFRSNMREFFQPREECSRMGRLGSLAYMHCYGLEKSNSAALRMLQENITSAAARARSVLEFENVKFAEITDHRELARYYQMVRASMEMYQDLILPWMNVVSGKMGHHFGRNRELQKQANACENRAIQKGSLELARSERAISSNQASQLAGFRAELAALDKMREKISYQLPLLSATEQLKRLEEKRRQEEEERRKKAEEERKKKEEEEKAKEEMPPVQP